MQKIILIVVIIVCITAAVIAGFVFLGNRNDRIPLPEPPPPTERKYEEQVEKESEPRKHAPVFVDPEGMDEGQSKPTPLLTDLRIDVDWDRKAIAGVMGVKCTVQNNSSFGIRVITVALDYKAASGKVVKTELLDFYNIPGRSQVYRAAPATDKGRSIVHRVVNVEWNDW